MDRFETLISNFSSVQLPTQVTIKEVGPRDGLQSEKQIIETNTKIQLINLLSECGFSSIEVTSFVSSKWIPQLADNSQVYQSITRSPGTTYSVLVPNMFGFNAAKSSSVEEISIFVSASESFSMHNTNCSIEESFTRLGPVVQSAIESGLKVRAYVSCVFSCPYDGQTNPLQVMNLVKRLISLGCYEVSLADTIGYATPDKTHELLAFLLTEIEAKHLAVHFHDTSGRAIENVITAFALGVTVADSAVGGLGGCPYAPGSPGNVATEDLVFVLESLGVKTGIDLGKLVKAAEWFFSATGIEKKSKLDYFKITKN